MADFNIGPHDGGTELTIHYSYTPNLLGRFLKGFTDKQPARACGRGSAAWPRVSSERVSASPPAEGLPEPRSSSPPSSSA